MLSLCLFPCHHAFSTLGTVYIFVSIYLTSIYILGHFPPCVSLTDCFLLISLSAHQLSKVEPEIQSAVTEIDELKMALKNEQDPAQSAFLRTSLIQVRDKVKQLRDAEKQLRDKKEQLRDERKQPFEAHLAALASEVQPIVKAAVSRELGTLPFPGAAKVRFSEEVWLEMCQSVQVRVTGLIEALEELKKVKVLSNMRSDISVDEAKELGIKVLHSESDKVLLGAFDVPDVIKIIESPPKGAFFFILLTIVLFIKFY
jgi:hypothetical protein